MNQAWKKVREFHEAFSVTPRPDIPTFLLEQRVQKRAEWLEEEIQELRDAKTVEDQADAMIDTIYFALGTLVEMGVQPEELFEIVHHANMNKLWEDGKPRYRKSDGKVIKPPTWQDPQPLLKAAIQKQVLQDNKR